MNIAFRSNVIWASGSTVSWAQERRFSVGLISVHGGNLGYIYSTMGLAFSLWHRLPRYIT